MTPQQIEAMKLALGQLQAGFVGNAMQILREALAEHAMRETQRLGQEIEPVADYIAARDMLDAKPVPPRTWVGLTDDEKNDCLVSADPCEALAEPEARQLIEDVEQALKERNQ